VLNKFNAHRLKYLKSLVVLQFFSVTLVHFSNHPLYLQSHMCILKTILQTAPHIGLPAKACILLKIFSSSLKSK